MGVATFKDGSTAEVDVIMMCTGYLHSYPFLREELRMKCKNLFYPPGLYKGIVWTAGVAPSQGRGHPHLQGQELCFKVHRHSVSNPPHQLHVRPRRLPRHLHAPNQEV